MISIHFIYGEDAATHLVHPFKTKSFYKLKHKLFSKLIKKDEQMNG